MILFQAFSLPVIQIVHETVRDAQSGRKSSRPSAAAPVGMSFVLGILLVSKLSPLKLVMYFVPVA